MAYSSYLTAEQAKEIKRQLCLGISMNTLARGFGVSAPAIQAIKDGRSWFRVPWPSGDIGPMPVRIKKDLAERRRAWIGTKRAYDQRIIDAATTTSADDLFWATLKGLPEPQKNARIWARDAMEGRETLTAEAVPFLENFFPGWRTAYPELSRQATDLGFPDPLATPIVDNFSTEEK